MAVRSPTAHEAAAGGRQDIAALIRRRRRAAAAQRPDAFPHTRRPLPWLLAAFLTMLFFVPIDSTELKVHLPVGSQIDRFAVVVDDQVSDGDDGYAPAEAPEAAPLDAEADSPEDVVVEVPPYREKDGRTAVSARSGR